MRLHRRLEGREAQAYWYRVRDKRQRVYRTGSPLSKGKGYLLGTFAIGHKSGNPVVEVWWEDSINSGISITEVYIYKE